MKKLKITDRILKDIFIEEKRKKGYIAYCEKNVTFIEKKDTHYAFVVKDKNKTYHVMIEVLPRTMNLFCDCGKMNHTPCTHLAAAMYDLKKRLPSKPQKKTRIPRNMNGWIKRLKETEKWLETHPSMEDFHMTFDLFINELHEELLEEDPIFCRNKLFSLYCFVDRINLNFLVDKRDLIRKLNKILKDMMINHYDLICEGLLWYEDQETLFSVSDIVTLLTLDVNSYLEAEVTMKLIDLASSLESKQEENLLIAKVKILDDWIDQEEKERVIKEKIDHYNGLKTYYIHSLLDKNDFVKVEEILMKDYNQNNLTEENSSILLKILLYQNKQKEVIDLLYDQFKKFPKEETYLLLKDHLNKSRFKKEKEDLLDYLKEKNEASYVKIIEKDHEKKRIFEYNKAKGIDHLDSKLDELKEEYAKELIETFEAFIMEQIESQDKKKQSEVDYYLYRLLEIDGSRGTYQKLVRRKKKQQKEE